jgi:hypothetical protein
MKFKLLSGVHVENGTQIEAGKVFESKIELDKLFPARFKVVEESDRPTTTVQVHDVKYSMKRNRGRYFVHRDHDNKQMNDTPLNKAEAQTLLDGLLG